MVDAPSLWFPGGGKVTVVHILGASQLSTDSPSMSGVQSETVTSQDSGL